MRIVLSLFLAFALGFMVGNGWPSQLGPDRVAAVQKTKAGATTAKGGTATPTSTATPAPTPTGAPPAGGIVLVGSNGWTSEAEALVRVMKAQVQIGLWIHLGDTDFSFTDWLQTVGAPCKFPGLRYYCDGDVVSATPDQMRAGWRSIMAPIFPAPGPWVVAYGNHETQGVKSGINPYYTALFGQTSQYFSRPFQTGMGDARLFVLSTTQPLGPGTPQRVWFEAELVRYRTATWKIIFAHGTPYSQEKPSLRLIDEGIPALLDAEGVDLWLGGHPLLWERTRQVVFNPATPQSPTVVDADDTLRKGLGRVYVSDGGGGMHVVGTFGIPCPSPLRSWLAKSVCVDNTFALLRWSADGLSLTVQAIDQRGAVRDSVRIAY